MSMDLSEKEIGMGIVVVKCKCCNQSHKAHMVSDACSYSLTPNYGCENCQGVPPKSLLVEMQAKSIIEG
jgi:hypothetical protein